MCITVRGEASDQILQLIEEHEQICQLVLGANTKSDSAGPIVNYITGKGAARCKIPVVIVPGNLTDFISPSKRSFSGVSISNSIEKLFGFSDHFFSFFNSFFNGSN